MKIIIAGNYGAGNLGDELILEGLLETLRDVSPEAKVTVFSARPFFTKKRHAKYDIKTRYKVPSGARSLLKSVFNGQLKRTLKSIKKADYFILGGGGLFDETSKKAIWIWSVQAWAAYHYKKPVIMYGQGISSIKSNWAKKKLKKYFRKAELIAVRDTDSKHQLKKLIRGKKILLMPDLLFKIRKLHVPASENTQTQPKILLALRPFKKPLPGFEKEIRKFIEENKDQLIPIPFQKQQDGHYLNPENPPKYTSNIDKILTKYQGANSLVAMRLHAILFAICTGTPFVAISYNPKVTHILETLGLQEYMIEIKELTSENLQAKLKEVLENHHDISIRLQKIAATQLQKHEEVEMHLKAILK